MQYILRLLATKLRRWGFALLSLWLALIALSFCMFFDCLPFYQYKDIDVNSGRIRHGSVLIGLQINQIIEDTWISRSVIVVASPRWRRVVRYSFGNSNSPHCLYHGAIAQIKTVNNLDGLVEFSPAARREIAETILRTWQHGSDSVASQYIECLGKRVVNLHKQGAVEISVEDLP